MPPRSAFDSVRIARANVRLAAQVCATAVLDDLQRAIDLLETSAVAMRQAEADLRARKPANPAELRRETSLLKREIASLLRVIDGCAALCRSLSLRLGCTGAAYTPQGREAAAPPSSAACGLQG